MSKSLFILFAVLSSTTLKAQISIKAPSTAKTVTIGKVNSGFSPLAHLYYLVNGNDSVCVLQFENQKLKKTVIDYQSVSFRPENGTLNTLYKLFKSIFEDENKSKSYRVAFTLGDESVSINVHRNSFVRMAEFRTDDSYFSLTEKQVDKLFGKN